MYKKIVLFAFIIIPAIAFAQEQKIGYINYGEVILAMPEYKQMVDSLNKEGAQFEAELKKWTEDYQKKYSEFMEQQETLNEAIKLRRLQDLETDRERLAGFQEFAQQKLETTKQALMTPIMEKFKKTLAEVGKENNFLYIIDSTVAHYIAPNAPDATPLVKKKLGIQ